MENGKQLNDLTADEKNSEDLAKLFDYPSVGELFSGSDQRRFDEFCSKLTATRENLERIIRYGTRDEAERATRAVRGIEVTLEFLQNLQKLRQNSQK
jgi:LDH2 family malate/lactate/ureidoglycolate dehydrogenase